MLAAVEGIEIRVSIDAQDDRLAIDDEMLLAVLQSGFDNPGEAFCPVVAAASAAVPLQLLQQNLPQADIRQSKRAGSCPRFPCHIMC